MNVLHLMKIANSLGSLPNYIFNFFLLKSMLLSHLSVHMPFCGVLTNDVEVLGVVKVAIERSDVGMVELIVDS